MNPSGNNSAHPLFVSRSARTETLPSQVLLYEEERRQKMRRAVHIGCALGCILVPIFGMLDYVVAFPKLYYLLGLRFVCSFNLLALLLLNRSSLGEKYSVHFAIYGTASVAAAIALMTYILGGPKSPYFAGIILTVIAAGILTPMTVWEGSITLLAIYLIYLLVSFPYLHGEGLVFFYNNSFFIIGTMVVTVLGLRLKERLSYHEIERRYQLMDARQELEKYTTNLEELVDEQTEVIRALSLFANQLNALETMKDVLRSITRAIHRYTHSDRAIILLDEGRQNSLVYAHGIGVEEYRLKGQETLGWESPLLQKVVHEEGALLIRDIDEGLQKDGILSLLGKTPWLGMCLRHFREPFGLILAAERLHPGDYSQDEVRILNYIGDSAAVALHNQLMTRHLRESYLNIIQALAYAIEAKDPYTRGHSERVRNYAVKLAKGLGLSENETLVISFAAILHDIGKVEIPRHIIQKPERLTADEYTDMKDHPALGEIMVEGIAFLEEAKPLIRHHHERWDGLGYPDGLKGEEIPLGSRIIAVADIYDALTFQRSYRKGASRERAILQLRKEKEIRLDPNLVEAFIANIKDLG